MISKTERDPGPVSVPEVIGFQTRHGLKVDGKVGRQTMGQALMVERAHEVQRARAQAAENRPRPKCTFATWVAALAAVIALSASSVAGHISGLFDWVWSLVG